MDNKKGVQEVYEITEEFKKLDTGHLRSAKTKLLHDGIEGIMQNTLLGARLTREMFNRISCKRCASNEI